MEHWHPASASASFCTSLILQITKSLKEEEAEEEEGGGGGKGRRRGDDKHEDEKNHRRGIKEEYPLISFLLGNGKSGKLCLLVKHY